jgi:N-acetylglucosaminyldiphosphoundecaprenol N-acetyl-beta-D-mannosaminyltransferase
MTRRRGDQATDRKGGALTILNVRVDPVNFDQTLSQIEEWITESRSREPERRDRKTELEDRSAAAQSLRSNVQSPNPGSRSRVHQICTVNPEFIMEARRNPAFAAVLASADLNVPDGVGVLWAARLQGVGLRERVTGSDGIYRICERAAKRGWRVFLLGAAPGVAEQAADRLQTRYPGLDVAGTFSGSPDRRDWPEIRDRLFLARPDILFVAYGHPRQDLWIHRHRDELPAVVAMGVGGAFDFVAGTARRAPVWLRRLGLEWLHRLLTQPWRWRRMRVLPLFAALVLGEKTKRVKSKTRGASPR